MQRFYGMPALLCLCALVCLGHEDAVCADNGKKYASGLVIDFGEQGIRTVDQSAGVYFDFDGDGRAENTTWIAGATALLVLDGNGDGRIDRGSELFGNFTTLPRGRRSTNAFAALARYDDDRDGRITPKDAIYSRLQLRFDVGGQGGAMPSDLLTLAAAGAEWISVSGRDARHVDRSGSLHRRYGSARVKGQEHLVAEVWFHVDGAETMEATPHRPSQEVLRLPHARGFGPVPDLRRAMAGNPKLKAHVMRFVAAKSVREADLLLDAILWEWVGVTNMPTKLRGGMMDARFLAVLEWFSGEEFRGLAGDQDPSIETHDVDDLQFADNRPRHLAYDERSYKRGVERIGRLRQFTGEDEDRRRGGFVPSRPSAEILMIQYAKLRAFVRSQLLAQSHYFEEFGMLVDAYDPRLSPHPVVLDRLSTAWERLLRNDASTRLVDIYCTLIGFTMYGGYSEQAARGADLMRRNAELSAQIALRLNPARIDVPKTWYADAFDAGTGPSLGCMDILRIEGKVRVPELPKGAIR